MESHIATDEWVEEQNIILSSISTETRKITSIHPFSDRKMYHSEKLGAQEIFRIHKSNIQKSSKADEECATLVHKDKFATILKKRNIGEDITLFLDMKVQFFVIQRQRSAHNAAILKEYRKKCHSLMTTSNSMKNNFHSMKIGLMWTHLDEFLGKVEQIYAALTERWMILESMLKEIIHEFDDHITNKYEHTLKKKQDLLKEGDVKSMLVFYDKEWKCLFEDSKQ